MGALWRLFTGVMNGSTRVAGQWLFITILINLTLLVVGWMLNITGNPGWNLVFVALFEGLAIMAVLPWILGALLLTRTLNTYLLWCLGEATTFLVLATLPFILYPEGFWAGFVGGVLVLVLVSAIQRSGSKWLIWISTAWAIGVIVFSVFYVLDGGPEMTKTKFALAKHQKALAESRDKYFAKCIESLPTTWGESGATSATEAQRKCQREAEEWVRKGSISSRVVAAIPRTRQPVTVSVKLSLTGEVVRLPEGLRGDYSISVPQWVRIPFSCPGPGGVRGELLPAGVNLASGWDSNRGELLLGGARPWETIRLNGETSVMAKLALDQANNQCRGKKMILTGSLGIISVTLTPIGG